VVAYAPHQQLIDRSALVITHGGLNTTLTALGCGVPVLAIPITNEQPGIAARLAYSGAGRALPVQKLGMAKLRAMVSEMLSGSSYKTNAQRLQRECNAAGGVSKAAELIEGI
jgi:UDP:flavonoid glycosyltransferase YjiC (YdhE family)